MAAEHTPGPWKQFYRQFDGHILIADEADTISIAKTFPCPTGLESQPDVMKANANLIAAAPELLEACEAVVARLDYLQNLWVKEGVTNSLCEQVRAAVKLAKAGPS